MALKEDDIKDLGLDIGEENVPQAVGACNETAEHGCPMNTEGCHGGCEVFCNYQREASCCEHSRQCSRCQDNCQRCEDDECGSCERYSQCGHAKHIANVDTVKVTVKMQYKGIVHQMRQVQ